MVTRVSGLGGTIFNYRAVGVSEKKKCLVPLKTPVRKLLRWRFEKARAEAPPAASAARLLALARPWWEASPERFRLAIQRLRSLKIAPPHPLWKTLPSCARGPLPTVIVRTAEELEASVRILSLRLDKGRMQLSFQCVNETEPDEQELEVTFVSESTSQPLFCALATRSLSGEYSLEVELSSGLVENWKTLSVTDPLPFRLILRFVAAGV